METPEMKAVRGRIDAAMEDGNLDAYIVAKTAELALHRLIETPEGGLRIGSVLAEISAELKQINDKLERLIEQEDKK